MVILGFFIIIVNGFKKIVKLVEGVVKGEFLGRWVKKVVGKDEFLDIKCKLRGKRE